MDERTCNRCNRRLVGRQTRFCSHACANRTHSKARAVERAKQRELTGPNMCDVDGCEKPARSNTAELCKMHYHRQYRYGTLERISTLVARGEREPVIRPHNIPGDRYGTLTLIEHSDSRWLCKCDCGETRYASTGELNRTGDNNTCGVKANHPSEFVDYSAAHGRVRRERGSASNHRCVDCARPAQHWSYNHADPDEQTSRSEATFGLAYSLSPAHYEARCVSCHKHFDMNYINSTRRVLEAFA